METGRHLRVAATVLSLVLVAGNANAQDEPSPPPSEPASQLPPDVEGPPPPPPAPLPPPAPQVDLPVPVVPPPPSVVAGPRFGDAGEVVITADSSIGISSTAFSQSDATRFSVGFSPGLDYFVIRHFSVGVDVNVAYANDRSYGADGSLVETGITTVSGGARLGLDLPLGDVVSFYPRLTLGVESLHRESKVVVGRSLSVASIPIGAPSETLVGPWVSVFAPILLHPTTHFFVGAGPALFHEFGKANADPSIGGERTSIVGRMVVGGWWGGDDAAESRATSVDGPGAPPPNRHAARFGDRDVWVLSGELGASLARATYGGVSSSVTSYSISPSFDYFVAPHVSLGLGGFLGHSSTDALRADGPKVQYDFTTLEAVGRLGVDIPLSSALSLYPRASLAVGRTSYDEKSGSDESKFAVINVTAGLYAPLLVHFAQHAFGGFGPSVSHDLSNQVEDLHAPNNLATTIGARLIVGGWLGPS
jgi:hypothetical protein